MMFLEQGSSDQPTEASREMTYERITIPSYLSFFLTFFHTVRGRSICLRYNLRKSSQTIAIKAKHLTNHATSFSFREKH